MKQTCPHNNETDASIQQCKQAVIEFHRYETVVYGLLMKLRVGVTRPCESDVYVCSKSCRLYLTVVY
jgi:hypothetical protein